MSCGNTKSGCVDPSVPTVDNSAIECCELTPSNCVVTSEYQSFFKIAKGKTLTYVMDTIAKFVKKNRMDIADLKLLHTYSEYSSMLTQAGTSAPVSTEVFNTIGGTAPTYSRTSPGKFLLTLAGAFPVESKVFITIGEFDKAWDSKVKAYWVDANSIAIESGNTTDYIDDDIITKMPLYIKVYN